MYNYECNTSKKKSVTELTYQISLLIFIELYNSY